MPSAGDGAEFLAELIDKRDRILARNPQAYARIMGFAPTFPMPLPPSTPAPIVVARPILEKGRYLSPTLARLIEIVGRHSDLSSDSIRGAGRAHRLVNARYCIANISEEFAPRLSARAVDDNMLRAEGMTLYYRMRHRDRMELFEDYLCLYERVRSELLAGKEA